jgi:uncharacterized protein (DUF2336 family)
MVPRESMIDQLERMLASKDLSRRAEALRSVTDLFIQGSGRFTDDQIELFDQVMGKLIENIERAARVAFGNRMARVADAPVKVIRRLAFDDAIEVAAPVLTNSPRLDDTTLVENARITSQRHLLAISARRVLVESVTDILIERGDQHVVASTASNPGAKFSPSGMSALVQKAHHHGDLALCVWSRPDIPRHDLVKLFAQASEVVRGQLEAADSRRTALVRTAVAIASDQILATARADSDVHAQALAHVQSLHSRGMLDETRLQEFAREGSFDKAAVALSLMCDLPIGLIERTLARNEPEQLLVFAKASDFSWETVKAIILLQAGGGKISREELNRFFASYFRLQLKTARAAIQFYRLREKAAGSSTH